MPFISRADIPQEVRRPYTKEYRVRLQQVIADPAASAEQKAAAKKQLDRIKGESK